MTIAINLVQNCLRIPKYDVILASLTHLFIEKIKYYIMILLDILSTLERVASYGDVIKGFAGYIAISAIYIAIRDLFPKKVNLSIGSFVVRRKHFNVQNVTNIVSAQFYEGGTVPDSVRREIILLTSPKVKKLTVNKNK